MTQTTLPGFEAIQPGTIVEHTVLRNGKERRFQYRREAGRSFSNNAGFWSYKPDGHSDWIKLNNPDIRRMLDAGLCPYEMRS